MTIITNTGIVKKFKVSVIFLVTGIEQKDLNYFYFLQENLT